MKRPKDILSQPYHIQEFVNWQDQQIKELKEVNELMVKDLIDIGYSENHYLIVKAKQALK